MLPLSLIMLMLMLGCTARVCFRECLSLFCPVSLNSFDKVVFGVDHFVISPIRLFLPVPYLRKEHDGLDVDRLGLDGSG